MRIADGARTTSAHLLTATEMMSNGQAAFRRHNAGPDVGFVVSLFGRYSDLRWLAPALACGCLLLGSPDRLCAERQLRLLKHDDGVALSAVVDYVLHYVCIKAHTV